MSPFPPKLADATLARLPIDRLDALESLRRDAGLTVAVRQGAAWVSWQHGRSEVIARLLPVPGIQFYVAIGPDHHIPGRWLPSVEVPADLAVDGLSVARAVVPEPIRPESPSALDLEPITPSLTDDDQPRPCSAWLGPLESLGVWADVAVSARIAELRGAVLGSQALVIGDPPPLLAGGQRFWGRVLLCPLGKSVRPSMTDRGWIEALGLSAGDHALLADDGIEVIPGAAIRTLGRPGIRLARREASR